MLDPGFATRAARPSPCAPLFMLLLVAVGVPSARAESEGQATVKPVELLPSTVFANLATDTAPFLPTAPLAQSSTDRQSAPAVDRPKPATRGALFATLEVSYVGLQALDTVGTLWALDNGFVEGNPMMRGVTARPAALVAIKAAATGGTMFLARRIARRHRMTGLVLMAALDAAYSFIAVRNFVLTASHTPSVALTRH